MQLIKTLRTWHFNILFLCISFASFGQKGNHYIVKGATYSAGKVMPLGNGRIEFRLTTKDKPQVYSASDILEYSYDGKVYQSFQMDGEYRFIRKLVYGKTSLYKNKNQFFIKFDSTLVPVSKNNFRTVMATMACGGTDASLARLSYSKPSLSYYVSKHNQDNCNRDQLPHNKIGMYAGFGSLTFRARSGEIDLSEKSSTPTAGIFYDVPLYRPQSLFLSLEANWFGGATQFFNEEKDQTTYLKFNFQGINSHMGLKWMIVQRKIGTYVKAGALISHLRLSSQELIETLEDESAVTVFRYDISDPDPFHFGFSSAIGLEIPDRHRRNFHVECKYVRTVAGGSTAFKLDFSGVSINAGFNF